MNNKVLMLREIFVCLRGKRVDVIINQDIKKILLIKNSFAKKCRGPFFIFGQIKPSFIFFLGEICNKNSCQAAMKKTLPLLLIY